MGLMASAGMFLEVEVAQPQEGGSDGHTAIAIKASAPRQGTSRLGRWLGRAPQQFQPGVIEVEEECGRMMSNALPVVVASSAAVVAELRQLEHDCRGEAGLESGRAREPTTPPPQPAPLSRGLS